MRICKSLLLCSLLLLTIPAMSQEAQAANTPDKDDAAVQSEALKTCRDVNQSFMFTKAGFIMGGDTQGRVFLYDNPDDVRAGQNEKNAYLINGDLVLRLPDRVYASKNQPNPFPDSICVVYKNQHHRAVMGWISHANFGDLEADFSQMSESVQRNFNKLPSRKWPQHFEKDAGVLTRPKQNGLRSKTYNLDIANECYWTAYLLNDVVWVEAVANGSCWGNHGDSNPSGPYDWR